MASIASSDSLSTKRISCLRIQLNSLMSAPERRGGGSVMSGSPSYRSAIASSPPTVMTSRRGDMTSPKRTCPKRSLPATTSGTRKD
jgi:hypothetical protein